MTTKKSKNAPSAANENPLQKIEGLLLAIRQIGDETFAKVQHVEGLLDAIASELKRQTDQEA